MKKLVLATLITIGLSSISLSPPVSAATPPDSCFAFTVGTGTITNYYNNESNNPANPACTKDIDIPSTIGGANVTTIGSFSLVSKSITSVTIPNTVATIGAGAFADNRLATITIPANVNNIGGNAFGSNGISAVTISNGAATFLHNSFVNNPVASMTIGLTTYTEQTPTTNPACFAVSGSTVTDYYQASPIIARNNGVLCGRNVEILNSMTLVGDYAFRDNQLMSIVIPNTVTGIGHQSFSNNVLTDVTIPTSITTIGNSSFSTNQISTVLIPSSVTSIGTSAFFDNEIVNLTLPNSLTSISDYSFSSNNIESIVFPNNLTSIGTSAFYTNKLASLTIPPTVTSIGQSAFSHNLLTYVSLPNTLTSIGDYAFYINHLENVTIPDGITSIGSLAFAFNAIDSLTLPDSVASIGFGAFAFQSQWGRDLWGADNGAPDFWSLDSAEVDEAYGSIWYARIYTENPSNPNNLTDNVLDENWWWGDDPNGNSINDSLGGHLINPASAVLQYVNQSNTSLQIPQFFTGLLNSSHLANYTVSQGPIVPIPTDPESPTPGEQAAIDEALSAYYRIGDTVTINPPAIDGYTTPPTQTFVLGAADNQFSYVYTPPAGAAASPTDAQLAATGMNVMTVAGLALVSMITGLLFWRIPKRTKRAGGMRL